MTSITLNVTGANIQAIVDGTLTSGMVGIPVTIQYDGIWADLTKNLVCRCGQWGPDRGETRTILNIGESATVAHEVMQPDMHLYLGVEGYSADGKLVIPTTWADCGKIRHGANAGADPSAEPKLPVWAQLMAEFEKIKKTIVTREQIAAVVEEYLLEHPGIGGQGSFSQALRVALYNLLMDGVYQSSGHEADKAALEELLTGGSATPDVPDEPEITYYTIEKTLTNVSISNGAATIAEGSAYHAILTANEGYTLGEVTVTMGGAAVPVTDCVISIASVTGDIVIVATAAAVGGYEWESGVAYDLTDKVTQGVELVTGSGTENAKATFVTTDYLNCFDADAIYCSVSLARLFFYDVNKNYISDAYKNAQPSVKAVPDDAVYVRLTCSATYWSDSVRVVPIAKTTEAYTYGTQNVTWETGRLNAATGEEVETANGCRTDYICMNGAQCLHIPNTGSFGVVCMYDANKTFICGASSILEPLDVSEMWPGISYIRVYMGVVVEIILDDSTVYTVTRILANVSAANANNACSTEPYTNTLTAKSGYTLDGGMVTVTMDGEDITETAYDAATGGVSIAEVTGNIVIRASAVAAAE